MFRRIKTSYYLFRGSLYVLNKDRELLVFPLLSGLLTIAIIATFVLPIIWAGTSLGGNWEEGVSEVFAYGILFVFYFISFSITYYFNTAIISCAIYRMKGGDPDLKGGFRAANTKVIHILAWALVSSTVGLILRFVQEKSGLLGKIAAGFVGVAWSVASYFVIPIMIMEKKGPIEALKESGLLVKKTWGEQVAGNLGMGFVFTLILLPAFIILPIIFMAQNEAFAVIGISAFVIYLVLVILLQSTLSVIYQAALYLYAREGYVPEGYSRGLLQESITTK